MTWNSAIWRYDLKFLQVQKNVLILLYCLFSCLFIALWGFPLTGKEKNSSYKGDIYWHFICDCEDPRDHLKIIWTTLHQKKKKKIHFFITVFFVFNAFELFPAVRLTIIHFVLLHVKLQCWMECWVPGPLRRQEDLCCAQHSPLLLVQNCRS